MDFPAKFKINLSLACLAMGLGLCTHGVEAQDATSEDRSETSVAIAENAQGAYLLRELLLGRQFTLFGRAEGDFAVYDIPSFDDQNGAEVRRLRAGIAGLNPWFENVSYKLEFDLADGDSTISSVYLAFDFENRGEIAVGNLDGSQSLSASTGSLSQLFMEAPLPIEAFGVSKRVGISYDLFREHYGLHLLIFGRDLNSDDKHQGLAARAWFNPHRSRAGIWHIGASILRENIEDEMRLSTRPESHVTDIMLVDTGWFDDVSSDRRLGLEMAGATGSFTTRLEVLINDWKRDDGSRNRFRGAYLEGGYFITGEPFRYYDGKFVRPKLSGQGMVWEAAYRLSWIDMNDDDVNGGQQFNAGLALNVYPRSDLRGQLNLIHLNSNRPDSDGWLFQGRLQFNW